MFKASYQFTTEYLKKMQNEEEIDKIKSLTLYPEGILVFEDDKGSTKSLAINPDVFYFWLINTIMDLQESSSTEFQSDFNDMPYSYQLKSGKLFIFDDDDKKVLSFSVARERFMQSLIDCAKEIKTTIESSNGLVKQVKEWQAYNFDRFK